MCPKLSVALVFLTIMAVMRVCPSYAENENDLFTFDNSRWMSLDHYKETKKSLPETTSENSLEGSIASQKKDKLSSLDHPSTPIQTVTGSSGVSKKGKEVEPAEPSRPLNLPDLPGINKGYSMNVSSTLEDSGVGAHLTHLEDEPDLSFRDENWQPASDASLRNSDPQLPNLNIRMTYLPNPEVRPIPSFQKDTYRSRMLENRKLDQPPTDKAATAALEAFKKKQLEALQSDRQTLESLQNAITKLGLQRELSFIPSGGTTLDATPAEQAKSSGIKSP